MNGISLNSSYGLTKAVVSSSSSVEHLEKCLQQSQILMLKERVSILALV